MAKSILLNIVGEWEEWLDVVAKPSSCTSSQKQRQGCHHWFIIGHRKSFIGSAYMDA